MLCGMPQALPGAPGSASSGWASSGYMVDVVRQAGELERLLGVDAAIRRRVGTLVLTEVCTRRVVEQCLQVTELGMGDGRAIAIKPGCDRKLGSEAKRGNFLLDGARRIERVLAAVM